MVKDRWNFQFNEFIDKLQLAAAIGPDPIKRRAFCAQFAKELAFVSLYLDALSVTGGDAPFLLDPPRECDFCKVAIEKQGFFVDGQTKGGLSAPWANMCPNCYADHGIGIGWGIGQLYRHGPSGVWRCIAGGDPRVDTSEDWGASQHASCRTIQDAVPVMSEWKARAISHKGKVYYDVASTARLLRTTAAKVRQLMGEGVLEWTQLRLGGRLVVRAESIAEYKRRRSAQ